MNLWKTIILVCFVFCQIDGFAQTPIDNLPEVDREYFLLDEPIECYSESLVQPTGLNQNFSDSGIVLMWKPIPFSIGCQIFGGPVNGNNSFNMIDGYELGEAFFDNSLFDPNREYRWNVRCACKNYPSTFGPFSEFEYFTTPNFGAPFDPDQADLVVLFPNPTSGELNLHYNMDVSENSTMDIYSVRGVRVLSLPLKSGLNYIDTTDLEKGYYIVNINANNERKKLSFVKS